MPHMPDSHHDAHDLELVAAFAAGDSTGADLETATALVAACADCAALHHDLRAIAAALPALPAPVRPRDFRLTPDQAAALRPRGLRALLAAFASPRLSFATPLGTGLAAIGIVGILVASGGLPAGGATSSVTRSAQAPGAEAPGATMEMLLASPGSEDAMAPAGPVGSPAPEAPAGSTAPAAAASGAPGDGTGGGDTLGNQPAPSAAPAGQPYANAQPSPAADRGDLTAGAQTEGTQAPDLTLLIVATASVLVGLTLVALRWGSRRLA